MAGAGKTLILIAHEAKLADLAKLIRTRSAVFEDYRLLATKETGELIQAETGLEVTSMFSGRKGGEIQLCGLICTNSVRAVYFIRDPENPRLDEPDITPFYRSCDLNNVPLATNMVTAVALTHWLGRHLDRAVEPRAPSLAEAG